MIAPGTELDISIGGQHEEYLVEIPVFGVAVPKKDSGGGMTDNAKKMQRIGSSEYESLACAAAIELYSDVDSPAMALCFNLIRAANRMTTDLEVSVHRPMGISFAGYRLLFTIRSVGQVNPNELARLSSVSTASMSSLLNTLEKSGLVTRAPDPEDKRKTLVQLSDEGEQMVADLCQINNQREQAWAAGLTETEASILVELLRKLLLHHPNPGTSENDRKSQ